MIDTSTLTSHPRVIAKSLELAADYIDRHGWWQGTFTPDDARTDTPPCCAAGALNAVVVGDPNGAADQHFNPVRTWRLVLSTEAKIALLDHLGLAWEPCEHENGTTRAFGGDRECASCDGYIDWLGHLDAHVGNWNDGTRRTQLEVTAALRGTAIELRQGVTR